MTHNLFLFVLLAGLNLLDIYTTLAILKQGGRELNPVMARLMRALGTAPALVIAKSLLLTLLYWQLESLPFWLLALLVGVYAAVVAHNFKQLK